MTHSEEIAWAAGLFEGEGTFYIQTKGKYRYANAALSTTDLDVIERFRSVVGVGTLRPVRIREEPRKPIYDWLVSDRPGFELLVATIQPWLGERRLIQLEQVLSLATPSKRQPNRRHLRSA